MKDLECGQDECFWCNGPVNHLRTRVLQVLREELAVAEAKIAALEAVIRELEQAQ